MELSGCPKLARPPEIGTQAEVKYREPEFEPIEYASNEMRKIEPYKDLITGKIVTLHSISDPMTEGAVPMTAIIKHIYEDKPKDVKLKLKRDQYLVVYDAHGKGQRVKVHGNLYRKGTVWRMADTNSIEVF